MEVTSLPRNLNFFCLLRKPTPILPTLVSISNTFSLYHFLLLQFLLKCNMHIKLHILSLQLTEILQTEHTYHQNTEHYQYSQNVLLITILFFLLPNFWNGGIYSLSSYLLPSHPLQLKHPLCNNPLTCLQVLILPPHAYCTVYSLPYHTHHAALPLSIYVPGDPTRLLPSLWEGLLLMSTYHLGGAQLEYET